jgi:hypothetical protein
MQQTFRRAGGREIKENSHGNTGGDPAPAMGWMEERNAGSAGPCGTGPAAIKHPHTGTRDRFPPFPDVFWKSRAGSRQPARILER